jgi:hypothetical protein
MPNGHPKWTEKELPKLEEFFSKIASVLEEFARAHNLMIERYYHQGSAWTFMFQNSKGGNGQIEVEKSGHDSVLIRRSWYIDDYDNNTRWLKYPLGKKYSLEHRILREVLEESLKQIFSWNKEDLEPHKNKYYTWSKIFSKAEFEQQQAKYPVPKQ